VCFEMEAVRSSHQRVRRLGRALGVLVSRTRPCGRSSLLLPLRVRAAAHADCLMRATISPRRPVRPEACYVPGACCL
jgi:hypothetical protein